jgi:hypothetical protein
MPLMNAPVVQVWLLNISEQVINPVGDTADTNLPVVQVCAESIVHDPPDTKGTPSDIPVSAWMEISIFLYKPRLPESSTPSHAEVTDSLETIEYVPSVLMTNPVPVIPENVEAVMQETRPVELRPDTSIPTEQADEPAKAPVPTESVEQVTSPVELNPDTSFVPVQEDEPPKVPAPTESVEHETSPVELSEETYMPAEQALAPPKAPVPDPAVARFHEHTVPVSLLIYSAYVSEATNLCPFLVQVGFVSPDRPE